MKILSSMTETGRAFGRTDDAQQEDIPRGWVVGDCKVARVAAESRLSDFVYATAMTRIRVE
jgi:hypothetical protein